MLGQFGNDDTARKLTPFMRAWPGEAAHARAVTGLDVLAAIGSDVALMLLNGIAQKVKFKGLQDKAREKIDAIAEARGLSTEELEDRLAPDLGLDEQGTLRLDFGPRAFKVGFDETLKPYVRESPAATATATARACPTCPSPRRPTTPSWARKPSSASSCSRKTRAPSPASSCCAWRWRCARAGAGRPRCSALPGRASAGAPHRAAADLGRVCEVEGRSGSYGGTLQACFRVAEDGSYTTAEDDPFELPEPGHG
jgi:hypothetical protein